MIAAFGRRRLAKLSRGVVALLVGVALGVGMAVGTPAGSAAAATSYGYDVSWPQCTVAEGGYGLPLPPSTAEFVVLGLTKGLPFTRNPCLARQLAWALTNSVPAQAYTLAAFPTTAQLNAYGGAGPWRSTTRAGALSNVGYAEAAYTVSTLAAVGLRPGMVWIDVEPRPAQPWPTGTALKQRENRYVLEGLMRGLRDAGYSYGLYSYLNGWQSITGSWRLPGVPVWATAGRLDYPSEALDACTRESFSGGKVYLAQWYDNTRDYDLTCDPYDFSALPMPPSSLGGSTGDFSGDWNDDLLARSASTAALYLYAGTGRGGLAAAKQVGKAWGSFDALETAGDLDGDGALDVVARRATGGDLLIYPGNGRGGWRPPTTLATGWDVYSAIVGIGDFNGDQRPDLLARESATGFLWLYAGNGLGGLADRVQVGQGWAGYDVLLGPGDVNGDGAPDLIARQTSNGYLWLYPGNGTGGWRSRARIGVGWTTMTAIAAPGDLTGDRVPDLVARDGSGVLWLYPRTAAGGWSSRIRVGSGWGTMNALF